MKLVFVTVSGRLPSWLETVAKDYKKKLSFWFSVECHVLPSSVHGREAQGKKKTLESETILNFLKDDDFVIVCDELGKSFTTPVFAKRIETILSGGKKRLVIVVGGAYGLTEPLLKRADLKLSLSPLVTSHHMALAFILEQVYRAMTILKNIKYHNE